MYKILIIDDEQDLLDIMSSVLEEAGFLSVCAKNGIDGISKLEENPDIALIITDNFMPTMDGVTTVKAIKLIGKYDHIPIIFSSSYGTLETITEMVKFGIKGWLTKPTNNDVLISSINNSLKTS